MDALYQFAELAQTPDFKIGELSYFICSVATSRWMVFFFFFIFTLNQVWFSSADVFIAGEKFVLIQRLSNASFALADQSDESTFIHGDK